MSKFAPRDKEVSHFPGFHNRTAGLVFFYSPVSGSCRRVEASSPKYCSEDETTEPSSSTGSTSRSVRPVERFAVATMPTLVVVEDKIVRARLERPRGCREIESFLAPWLK